MENIKCANYLLKFSLIFNSDYIADNQLYSEIYIENKLNKANLHWQKSTNMHRRVIWMWMLCQYLQDKLKIHAREISRVLLRFVQEVLIHRRLWRMKQWSWLGWKYSVMEKEFCALLLNDSKQYNVVFALHMDKTFSQQHYVLLIYMYRAKDKGSSWICSLEAHRSKHSLWLTGKL